MTAANALAYQGNGSSATTLTIATTSLLDVADFSVRAGGNAAGNHATLKLQDDTSLSDSMTLRLVDHVAGAKGKVNLNFSGTESISALFINGNPMAAGTYGATGSGAQHVDDVHFTGTGVLMVPEPATMVLSTAVSGALLMRRRRTA